MIHSERSIPHPQYEFNPSQERLVLIKLQSYRHSFRLVQQPSWKKLTYEVNNFPFSYEEHKSRQQTHEIQSNFKEYIKERLGRDVPLADHSKVIDYDARILTDDTLRRIYDGVPRKDNKTGEKYKSRYGCKWWELSAFRDFLIVKGHLKDEDLKNSSNALAVVNLHDALTKIGIKPRLSKKQELRTTYARDISEKKLRQIEVRRFFVHHQVLQVEQETLDFYKRNAESPASFERRVQARGFDRKICGDGIVIEADNDSTILTKSQFGTAAELIATPVAMDNQPDHLQLIRKRKEMSQSLAKSRAASADKDIHTMIDSNISADIENFEILQLTALSSDLWDADVYVMLSLFGRKFTGFEETYGFLQMKTSLETYRKDNTEAFFNIFMNRNNDRNSDQTQRDDALIATVRAFGSIDDFIEAILSGGQINSSGSSADRRNCLHWISATGAISKLAVLIELEGMEEIYELASSLDQAGLINRARETVNFQVRDGQNRLPSEIAALEAKDFGLASLLCHVESLSLPSSDNSYTIG